MNSRLQYEIELEADAAADEISDIGFLKEQFLQILASAAKKFSPDADKLLIVEEQFDDLLYGKWMDAVAISGSLETYPESQRMQKHRRLAFPRQTTNPNTLLAQGVEI